MGLQVYRKIIIISLLLIVISCKTNDNKVNNDKFLYAEQNQFEKGDFSVIIYRLYIEGEHLKDRYSSDCIKNGEEVLPDDDDYYGSIEYGDLFFSFLTSPELVGSYIHNHNLLSIMNNKKIMTIVIPLEEIGNHFYIDSLQFKEGQYHLNLKNDKYDIISLEDRSNELERWKNSNDLLNQDCTNKRRAYRKFDSISNENVIRTVLKFNYYAIEQSDLTTAKEYKKK